MNGESQWTFTLERFQWLRSELSRRVPMLERLGSAFSILLDRFLMNPPRAETVAIQDLEDRILSKTRECNIADLLTIFRSKGGSEHISDRFPTLQEAEVAPPPIVEDQKEWNRYLRPKDLGRWTSRFHPVLIPMLLTVRAAELLGSINNIEPHIYEEAQSLTESLLREIMADVVPLSSADDVLAVSQMLYWPHNEFVFVFSRSPGIMLPEQRYQQISSRTPNEFVASYFQNMLDTPCEVAYHFSPTLVHEQLHSLWPVKQKSMQSGYDDKGIYQSAAKILIHSYLSQPLFHLFAMDQDDIIPKLGHIPIIGSGGAYLRQYETSGDVGLLVGPRYVPLVIAWIARCLGSERPERIAQDARAAMERSPAELRQIIEAVISERRHRIWPPESGRAGTEISWDPAWASSKLIDLLGDDWKGGDPADLAGHLWGRN